ncbi:MAG: hypothetical protein HOV94_22715 [Saccharothrix sp.]|nr:hypothetical protein [Saccharothrix sp.]
MNQQQIHPDDALAAFRKRCGELHDENILLRALTTGLERRIAELEQANPIQGAQGEAPQEPAFDGPR